MSSSFRFSPDLGKLYENVVAITLHRHEMNGSIECFYWQGSQREEVDFVVKQGTRIAQLIQVCIAVDDPKTKARETRALLKASSELGCKDLLVLTDSTEAEEDASWYGAVGRVRYVPAWKWLLANSTTFEAT